MTSIVALNGKKYGAESKENGLGMTLTHTDADPNIDVWMDMDSPLRCVTFKASAVDGCTSDRSAAVAVRCPTASPR